MNDVEGILSEIRDCMIEFKIDEIGQLTKKAIDARVPPLEIISKGMSKGMEVIGEKFEKQEFFLSELIMAGEIMKEGMKALEPFLEKDRGEKLGVVVLGTVKGDLHDIGKNIVKVLLTSGGFEVHDLGIDVPTEKFVESVRENDPDILGLSALLTTTISEIENVIEALEEEGLRNKLKVIIGGAALSNQDAEKYGADAYGADAVQGAKICKKWMED
jgi:5-methyltetrahydrofolate--homocysteine methyltransferase